MSKWVCVEDRLPEEGSRVVAAHMYEELEGGDPDAFVSWYCDSVFTVDTDGLDAFSLVGESHAMITSYTRVTHWCELPLWVK